MEDYHLALNCHVNIIMSHYQKNPEYYVRCKRVVRYTYDDTIAEVQVENISDLFVIDYMKKYKLDKILRFTLHNQDKEYYWITLD